MAQISVELLIGLAGISTFLVGFMSVRLSNSTDAARARSDLLMVRISDDARQQNLLPLPSDIKRLRIGASHSSNRVYLVASTIVLVALVNLVLSTVIAWPNLFGKHLVSGVIVTQVVHLSIILLGFLDATIQSRELSSLLRGGIASDFHKLESVLAELATDRVGKPHDSELIDTARGLCVQINGIVPDWCWVTLIQADLDVSSRTTTSKDQSASDEVRPALVRIRDLAVVTKNRDANSLLAWLWSVLLISEGHDSALISNNEVKRANKVRNQGILNEMAVRRYETARDNPQVSKNT